MTDIASIINSMNQRISALERGAANSMMNGTAHEVDAAKGKYRMKVGENDGKPILSPWINYQEDMGTMKTHAPPSVGQQMTALSKGGDWAQGLGFGMSGSSSNKSPSDKGDEWVKTIGGTKITIKGDSIEVVSGGSSISMVGGKVTIKGSEIVTDGKTILNNGTREVVFKGSRDNHNDINVEGVPDVLV